jgi:hypothetical protein
MTETPGPDIKPPLTPLRRFFAVVGGLITLFAGGCGLFFAGAGIVSGFQGDEYSSMLVILGLLYGGVPALIGGLVWWAAVKWRRG